jgi:hypothetical protein
MNLSNFHTILPEVLCDKIRYYLRIEELYLTNKTDYTLHKTEIYTSLDRKKLTKSYVIRLLRNDYEFIFNILLDLKFKMWYKAWKINYKGNTLPCFIELLNLVCIENKSETCRKLIKNKINKKLEGKRIRKNKHKRIRLFNNKWSN